MDVLLDNVPFRSEQAAALRICYSKRFAEPCAGLLQLVQLVIIQHSHFTRMTTYDLQMLNNKNVPVVERLCMASIFFSAADIFCAAALWSSSPVAFPCTLLSRSRRWRLRLRQRLEKWGLQWILTPVIPRSATGRRRRRRAATAATTTTTEGPPAADLVSVEYELSAVVVHAERRQRKRATTIRTLAPAPGTSSSGGGSSSWQQRRQQRRRQQQCRQWRLPRRRRL